MTIYIYIYKEFSIKRQNRYKVLAARRLLPDIFDPRSTSAFRRCSAAAAFASLADDLFPRWLPSLPSPVRSLLILGPNWEPVNLIQIPITADRRVGFRRILDFPSQDFSASGRFHRSGSSMRELVLDSFVLLLMLHEMGFLFIVRFPLM